MSVLICNSWGDWEDGSPSWSLSRPRNVILWIIPSLDCLIISKQPELNCLNSIVIMFVFNCLLLSVSLEFSLCESQWGKNIYIIGRMFLLKKMAASFLILFLGSSLLFSVLLFCAQSSPLTQCLWLTVSFCIFSTLTEQERSRNTEA